MDSTHARHHHHGSNLAQYDYVAKKYGRRARAEPFWTMAVLIVLLIGSLVVMYTSEPDAAKRASLQSRQLRAAAQQHYIDNACFDGGPDDCDKAKEEIKKENCQLYGEGCATK
jgi:hypothetical protein